MNGAPGGCPDLGRAVLFGGMIAAAACPEEKSLLTGEATLTPPSPCKEVGYDELHGVAIGSRRVVVLAGYSGAGYQHPEVVDEIVAGLVKEHGDNTLFIAGATKEGIGGAYAVIRRESAALGLKNVKTAGLISERGRDYAGNFAEMDYLCYVPSPSWEVLLPHGLTANVDIFRGSIDPKMVCLGGGKVAAAELAACIEKGFPSRVYAGPSLCPNRATPGVIDPTTGMVSGQFQGTSCDIRRAPCWPKVVQSVEI